MDIGLVGKPNVGKSTFFAAATLASVQIADYPFTTIEANRGVSYVRTSCPCTELKVTCTPRHGRCEGGTRFVPVELVDVAGLVPGAHSGRGRGNEFLDDLRQAAALIHVVDASGRTDSEGNQIGSPSHDPLADVAFLQEEIDLWVAGLLGRGWDRTARAIESAGGGTDERVIAKAIAERVTGLGITELMVRHALKECNLPPRPTSWDQKALHPLASALRRRSKPLLVAANKADLATEEQLRALAAGVGGTPLVRVSAATELALRRGDRQGVLHYRPGERSFSLAPAANLSGAQEQGIAAIDKTLRRLGSTGVQEALEKATFELLGLVPAFPVEDETKLTDKEGRVLPDCHLLPPGSTAKDLAYKVHTDLGDHFIRALNVRTRRVVGADYAVARGDVLKIVSSA